MPPANTAAALEHQLTQDILRGIHLPGDRLPTVRELAASFGVNPATVQRVVARLEARGLVTPRQGSGLRVNDPTRSGDTALLPDWIEATLDDPDRATSLLEDLLEVRRVLSVRLMVRHHGRLQASVDALAPLARAVGCCDPLDLGAVREADLEFVSAVVRATGNLVALTVFNTVARLVRQVPQVAEAMYADPEANAVAMGRVLSALLIPPDDLAEVLETELAELDAETVARFHTRLAGPRRAVASMES